MSINSAIIIYYASDALQIDINLMRGWRGKGEKCLYYCIGFLNLITEIINSWFGFQYISDSF